MRHSTHLWFGRDGSGAAEMRYLIAVLAAAVVIGSAPVAGQEVQRTPRVAPDTLLYDVRVNDPTTWTRSWSYAVPMQLNPDPLYDYACHEGNYGLYNILAGALEEQLEAEAAAASR